MQKNKDKNYTPGFLLDTVQTRGQWSDIFKVLKENNCQHPMKYLSKMKTK